MATNPFYRILFIAIFFSFFVPSVHSQNVKKSKKIEVIEGKKYYIHEVLKGQTLYAIAHAYEMKVNDLVIENPSAIDGITPGQRLKIPLPKEKIKVETLSKADSAKYYFHQVQQGETLYSLSKFYDITITKIYDLNPEAKDGIKAGQALKIPADKAKTAGRGKEAKPPVVTAAKGVQKTGEISKIVISSPQAPNETKVFTKADTSGKKNNFNIALFLPFHLNENQDLDVDKVVSGEQEISNKSEIAIQFYQGAQMAIDSLKKSGLSAKVYVYDVNETDSAQLQDLLKKPDLSKMDLMIGPLYSADFVPFSKYAKENQIFIVSPLSQQNKILFNNPYVSKVTASVTTQTEQMADYISEKHKNDNIIVVNSGNPKDAPLVKTFINKANKNIKGTTADSVIEVNGFGGIGNFIHSNRTNVVIVPSNNKSFVTDFITKLNPLREKDSIVLFGMESWSDFDNLDLDYLSNMHLHYPASAFVDYGSDKIKSFANKYITQYKTDPGDFVFQGFDVTWFYLGMLYKYGLKFQNNLSSTKQAGLQTSFEFYQVSPESGFENKSVYMLMLQDYKLVKTN